MDGKESAYITNHMARPGTAWSARSHVATSTFTRMGRIQKTFLSAYYDDKGQHGDITNKDVSKALKAAAMVLEYPTAKGILIDRIDTHSL